MNIRLNLSQDPYPGKPVRPGDRGNSVAKVQVWLNFLSKYYPALHSLQIDGNFGEKTKTDVVVFQKEFALAADGVVGPATWGKLSAVYNDALQGRVAPIVPRYPGYPLTQGSSGDHVKLTQYMLDVVGTSAPQVGQPKVDGIYGSATAQSVKTFQRLAGLTPDGVTGPKTWSALVAYYTRVMNGQSVSAAANTQAQYTPVAPPAPVYNEAPVYDAPPTSSGYAVSAQPEYSSYAQPPVAAHFDPEPIPAVAENDFAGFDEAVAVVANTTAQLLQLGPDDYPGTPVQYGDTGANVLKVQTWLNIAAGAYPCMQRITADGRFGSATQNQVELFQQLFGLPIDGVVGRSTWNKLVSVKNAIGQGNIPAATPLYIGYPVSQGASGNYVRILQYMINVINRRYPSVGMVTIDGMYGTSTTNAVKRFQSIVGLTADGSVGPNTFNQMLLTYTSIMNGQTPPDDQYPGTPIGPGATGPNVVKIQTWLNTAAAHYSPMQRITVDGNYGPSTQAQVEVFQTMFGLTQDGVVGENTWNQLVRVKNLIAVGTIPAITPLYIGYPVSIGASGNYVKVIQYMLNILHDEYPSIPLLTVDGQFGNITASAVRAFQALFGLPADGVVGLNTFNELLGVYTEIMNGRTPEPPDEDDYPGTPVQEGDTGPNVVRIQTWINIISQAYSPIPQLVVDGDFGPVTAGAVRAFQTLFGLPVDGIVGEMTWNAMVSIKNSLGQGITPPATPRYIGYPVSAGATGDYVKTLQYMLDTIQPYYPSMPLLTVDGVYGASTTAAVMAFQSLFGLNTDGIVGQTTFNTLLSVYTQIMNGVVPPPVNPDQYPGTPIGPGATGPDVVKIQTWLNTAAAHYSPMQRLTVDGNYGPKTEGQVQVFQTMFGLTQDGVVGQNTWNQLVRVKNLIAAGTIPPITPLYIGYPVSQGASGNYVRVIQYMINILHAQYPAIPLLTVDGMFGSMTTAAVKAFQALFGLPADGIVGLNTWNELLGIYTEIMSGRTPPPPDPDTYPGTPIGPGATGPNVVKIQTWLNTCAQAYSPITRLTVDGNYGPKTQSSVEAFQTLFGLSVDGIVGRNTWNALVSVKNSLARGVVPPATPKYIGYPVSQGATGNYVRVLQYMLNTVRVIYPTIPLLTVDGIYGSITANAVRIFQAQTGLSVDGVVGQNTFNRLLAVYTQVMNGQTPQPGGGDEYPGTPVRFGTQSEDVRTVQRWLDSLTDPYGALRPQEMDGRFGVETLNNVTAFQNLFGLIEDGVVGRDSWNRMREIAQRYQGGAITPITPKYPGETLRMGSSGNSVRTAQYLLTEISARHPSVPAVANSGYFGAGMRNAVLRFQREFGLSADGVIGFSTWSAMMQVYNQGR